MPPGFLDVPGFGARHADTRTRVELVALFSGLPLEFAPGSAWSYSNSGYFLLGLVIEDDLVRWFAALSHGSVVPPADFARMSQRTVLSGGKSVQYGFGLAPREVAGHSCIGHIGQISGFVSTLHYYPVDDLYIAVLVNTEIEEASNNIAEKIARTVFDSK
jgi:CubicO group peptidase (beta-lactamase class C family)